MVVSPVSLTPEEVELPPGARQKMPTLLGLGAALGVPASEYEDVDPELDELDGTADLATALAAERGPVSSSRSGALLALGSSGLESSAGTVPEVTAPDAAEVETSVQRLADFALKLSIGPLSRQWLPEVRSAVQVLLAVGKQRKEPTLSLVSGRLNGLIGSASVIAASVDGTVPVAEQLVADRPVAALPSAALPSSTHALEAAPADVASVAALEAGPNAGETSPGAELGSSPEAAVPETQAPAPVAGEPPLPSPSSPETSAESGEGLQKTPEEPRGGALVVVSDVARSAGPLRGAMREQMLYELTRLAGLLPEWPAVAQDLAEETRRRETRLVRALLESVDGLRRDHRARVAEQVRFEELAALAPEALAEEFETPVERAAELSQVLAGYRVRRESNAPDVGNVHGLERALAELERAQERFEDCDPERKDVQRAVRAERRRAATGLCLELAERGELEQLDLLEPLSVAERIERMQQWLASEVERPSPA